MGEGFLSIFFMLHVYVAICIMVSVEACYSSIITAGNHSFNMAAEYIYMCVFVIIKNL